ncbi:MAG: glycosyltransferase family 2 protein [Terriglobia bacterium]
MKNLIVIPAYNEEVSLEKTVASLQRLSSDVYEILVVNDGSSDRTHECAQRAKQASKLEVQIISLGSNGGIGVAVQAGYIYARKRGGYRYLIQFDADGQHEASYIEPLVSACETERLDLCIGSRFLEMEEGNYHSTIQRRLGIRFCSMLIYLLSGVMVKDPTSGFRCIAPRVWEQFADNYPAEFPEPVSLFWCARNKLRIGEIPVRMHKRQGGISSIRRFKTLEYMLMVSLAIVVDRLRMKEMMHFER